MGKGSWWSRYALFVVGGVVLLGLGAGGAAVVLSGQDAPKWLGAASSVSGVSGVLVPLWGWLYRRRQDALGRTASGLRLRFHVKVWHKRRLPKVGEVEAAWLGVRPAVDTESKGQVPYLPRDRDRALDELLSGGGMVLLHGPSAAGKTRAAFEAVRRACPDRDLLAPRDATSLRALVTAQYRFQRVVLWLDELDEFLTAEGLDDAMLATICPPGRDDVTIVATIRDEELSTATRTLARKDRGGIAPPGAKLLHNLGNSRKIAIDRALSQAEKHGIGAVADDRVTAASQAPEGFGAHLVAGAHLEERWRNDDGPEHARGRALISAAVDCRRAGYHQPVPRETLVALHTTYLDPAHADRTDLLSDTDSALSWCCEPVMATSSCLIPDGDGYRAADYLIGRIDTPVESAVWDALHPLATARPEYAVAVARSAYAAERPDVSERFAQLAVAAEHPEAMVLLGGLWYERGDTDQAETLWRRAAHLDDVDAMRALGDALDLRGDTDEAETWFRSAAERGSTAAMTSLGSLHRARGELRDAESRFRAAAEQGDTDAMTMLAAMLHERGDTAEAESLWCSAVERAEPFSAIMLGLLCHQRGDVVAAEALWRDTARHNAEAMLQLGATCYERGEMDAATALWAHAAEFGDVAAVTGWAGTSWQRGDRAQAVALWSAAADQGQVDAAALLGTLSYERGDLDDAETRWRQAADGGSAMALHNLGILYRGQDNLDQAETVWRAAADQGYVKSMTNVGSLCYQRGDVSEAETLWRAAADHGNDTAVTNLDILLEQRGDIAEPAESAHADTVDAASAG